ncbi:putative sterigmatocystin biosynthesis P450 monooxygenase [Lasiodiplodia theobromae]|uniref:Putative sterigmatocystin biosynthesis P450 monooxygenase n=1 Tax=Lasiodiplodia theobromae TaxID=45133 RepID=A0A5N5DC56_9PEZI|nr:putative sterigmatocystin biosynthesis P450 monooxygenase [Lasiodiplodia theobromae]
MFLVSLLFSAACLWIAGRCFYNLYLHPLRSYPGPWLCRASSLPRIWHRTVGTNISHAHHAHEKYGPVVRLSPGELSYINYDAWNDIYGRNDGKAALPKDPTFNSPSPDYPPGLVQVTDGPPHARQRRIFAPAFSNTSLMKQEAMLRGHVRKMVAKLQRACDATTTPSGAELDICSFFNFLTFDVMADLAFGAPLGLLDAGQYTPWVKNVFAVFRILSLRAIILFYLPQLQGLMTRVLARPAMVAARKAHIDYAAGLVDRRLDADAQTAEERPDVWALVEKKMDVLTREEMHINAATFMAAGTETTATALCGVVWFLAREGAAMGKVTEEVRGLSGGEEDLTMDTLARLPYLNAVINEAMRLYPPTPDMLYRLVPEGGAMVCGKLVPAGTVVGIHQWPAYHSAHNFARPEEFIPERWLPEASVKGEFVNDERRIVQPFSKGPRSCIGKNLALHEMRLALASTFRQFDIVATDDSKDWMQRQKCHVVWEKPPLMMKVKPVV